MRMKIHSIPFNLLSSVHLYRLNTKVISFLMTADYGHLLSDSTE
jgi:hypothetical protein